MPDQVRHDGASCGLLSRRRPAAALRHRHDLPACIFHQAHHPQPFRLGAFRNLIGRDSRRLFFPLMAACSSPGAETRCAPGCAPPGCLRSRREGLHQQQPGVPGAAAGAELDRSADVVVDRQAMRHAQRRRRPAHRAQCRPGRRFAFQRLSRSGVAAGAADRGASSPRLPGTIQSSARSLRPGVASWCRASRFRNQRDEAFHPRRRPRQPSLEQEDGAGRPRRHGAAPEGES